MLKKDRTKETPRWLLVLALVFLTNPVVVIFDYLPDLVGYLIIAGALKFLSDRAPYFEEARGGFLRLALVSLVKLPAYVIMTYAKGQNVGDSDINALFAFSFTVIEAVLLFGALKNTFEALSYLGQRSDAAALLKPFPISKRTRTMTPERLQILTYIFVGIKAAATALPEMLLLTRGVSADEYGKVFNLARLYPYVIIFAFVLVFVLGIILTKRFSKYLRAIYSEGKIRDAADSLHEGERLDELRRKLKLKDIKFTLAIFIASAVLTLNISFDNLEQVNLLPDFLFGILMLYGVYRLLKHIGGSKKAIALCGVYSAVSLVFYIIHTAFLIRNGYDALATSKIAKAEYIPVMISSGAELLALVLLFVSVSGVLLRFAATYTGLNPHDRGYSRYDAEQAKMMKRRVCLWCGFGILGGVCKLLETIFRYPAKIIYIATEQGSAAIAEGIAPWFGVVTLVCCALFIAYTVRLFSLLREEARCPEGNEESIPKRNEAFVPERNEASVSDRREINVPNLHKEGDVIMTTSKIGKILKAATAVMAVVLGVLFIIAVCHLYYTGGETPYSRERVGDYLAWLIIPGIITLLLVIAGIIYNLVTGESDVAPTERTKGELLESFKSRYDLNSLNGQEAALARKLERRRNIIDFAVSQISAICFVFILDYLLFIAKFSVENMNAEIMSAFAVCLPIAALGIGIHAVRAYFSERSAGEELEALRAAVKNNGAQSVKKQPQKKEKRVNTLLITRIAVAAIAVILTVAGIFNGGMEDVLQKAVKICTECIGLG